MGYRYAPELATAVAQLPLRDLTDLPGTRAALRQALAAQPPVDTTGVSISDRIIPGLPGRPAVEIRLYQPDGHEPAEQAPAILHAHGGGFVMCDVESSHSRNVDLVRALGVTLVSVDYRLAPEHPYPAALDEVHAALLWLADEAGALGVDRDRIAVHGISAGAGLVAGLALRVRDHGGPSICFQYLGIPVLDDRQRTASIARFVDTPQWDAVKARISWAAYLGSGVPGTAEVSPYAAPARATDLAGLPPAYISAMEFDPLRDEAVEYAEALLAAAVPTELHVFPGTFHGSSAFRHAPVTRREQAEEITVLQAAFAVTPVPEDAP